jgi:hypothetical protein
VAEEEIDLAAVHAELVEIEKEIVVTTEKRVEFLAELGPPYLPGGKPGAIGKQRKVEEGLYITAVDGEKEGSGIPFPGIPGGAESTTLHRYCIACDGLQDAGVSALHDQDPGQGMNACVAVR